MRSMTCFLFSLAIISTVGCKGQHSPDETSEKIGGPCEGCEAIYESPIPFEKLNNTDTLPDFNDGGPKIEISGIIYQRDGRTPAPKVVLYIYHTDQKGIYAKKGNETGWGKRHGFIRGWIKTDTNGFYRFFTLVPAAYPGRNNPKHIHPVIKEPGKNEYFLDELLFDDDTLLTSKERNRTAVRGGAHILKPMPGKGFLHATHNIILGLNIPGYPERPVGVHKEIKALAQITNMAYIEKSAMELLTLIDRP